MCRREQDQKIVRNWCYFSREKWRADNAFAPHVNTILKGFMMNYNVTNEHLLYRDELRKRKNETARIHRSLIRRGFDESRGRRVRCSQCQACVCNGIPLHEIGCPNSYRGEWSWIANNDNRACLPSLKPAMIVAIRYASPWHMTAAGISWKTDVGSR